MAVGSIVIGEADGEDVVGVSGEVVGSSVGTGCGCIRLIGLMLGAGVGTELIEGSLRKR